MGQKGWFLALFANIAQKGPKKGPKGGPPGPRIFFGKKPKKVRFLAKKYREIGRKWPLNSTVSIWFSRGFCQNPPNLSVLFFRPNLSVLLARFCEIDQVYVKWTFLGTFCPQIRKYPGFWALFRPKSTERLGGIGPPNPGPSYFWVKNDPFLGPKKGPKMAFFGLFWLYGLFFSLLG